MLKPGLMYTIANGSHGAYKTLFLTDTNEWAVNVHNAEVSKWNLSNDYGLFKEISEEEWRDALNKRKISLLKGKGH